MISAMPVSYTHLDVYKRQALNNATLPFVVALAQKGTRRALEEDVHLLAGLNVARGVITCGSVAEAHGLPFPSAAAVLEHL